MKKKIFPQNRIEGCVRDSSGKPAVAIAFLRDERGLATDSPTPTVLLGTRPTFNDVSVSEKIKIYLSYTHSRTNPFQKKL
jgi:hypothetical protein